MKVKCAMCGFVGEPGRMRSPNVTGIEKNRWYFSFKSIDVWICQDCRQSIIS